MVDGRILLFRIFKAEIGRTKIKSCQIAAIKIGRKPQDKKGNCYEKENLNCFEPSLHSNPARWFFAAGFSGNLKIAILQHSHK